jgi:hypothetical protein
MRFDDPSEAEFQLRRIAKANGIKIRRTVEYSQFFENYSAVAFHNEKMVVADVNKNDLEKYVGDLGALEHEIIHGL